MPLANLTSPGFVTLARLLRPQGRRGELLAELFTESSQQFSNELGVYVVPPGSPTPSADASRVRVESFWLPTGRNAGRIVLKLAGCDTISDAEKLAGAAIMLPAAERPVLDEDTFYISDLAGCSLFDHDQLVGEVIDVEFASSPDGRTRLEDAPPLLAVRAQGAADNSEPTLVPFVRAYLRRVDLPGRRISMDLPPGLVDVDQAGPGDPEPGF